MVNKANKVRIVFENVEIIEIPYSDIRFVKISGITEWMWDNNLRLDPDFDLELEKTADYVHFVVMNKQEYNRLKEHDDITSIIFLNDTGVVLPLRVNWKDGSDQNSNLGQTVRCKNGQIDVLIKR